MSQTLHVRCVGPAGAAGTAIVAGALLFLPARPIALFAQTPTEQAPVPRDQTFRSDSSDLVVVPVLVTDKQGKIFADLTRERFVVFDNGRQVAVDLFTNQDTPVNIGLIIDASTSMAPKMGEVLSATLAFARSSNPEDELFALRFNDDVQDAVPERPALRAGDLGALASAIASVRPEGRTALYDALLAGLDRLDSGSRSRKVLIAISDGGDNASDATLEAVLARARRSDAAIYTVGLFDDGDMDSNPGVLKSLAETTGGARFLPHSAAELLQACERIAREIRSGYTLGYVPPARDGAFHKVRVTIQPAARNLTLRARPGYFAARPVQP
jgi:Ca-activated chloride channel family protein